MLVTYKLQQVSVISRSPARSVVGDVEEGAVQCVQGTHAQQSHRAVDLDPKYLNHRLDAGLPAGGEREQIRSADQYGRRTHGDGLEGILTAADATVEQDSRAASNCVHDLSKYVECSRQVVQLPSAVV